MATLLSRTENPFFEHAEVAHFLAALPDDTTVGRISAIRNDAHGRALVDGFETPPVVMMPHNPPCYRQLLERAGFVKAMDLLAYEGGRDAVPARLI